MASGGRLRLVDLSGTLEFETDAAIKVDFGGDEPVWIPKSQCEYSEESDGTVTVTMEEQLARKKDLI